MWVQSLGQEDPLEEGMATHSSIFAWRSPWTEEPDRLQSMGSQRVRDDRATNSLFTLLYIDGIILYILSCNLEFFFLLNFFLFFLRFFF